MQFDKFYERIQERNNFVEHFETFQNLSAISRVDLSNLSKYLNETHQGYLKKASFIPFLVVKETSKAVK